MDALAATQIIKLIMALLLVIALFLCVAFIARHKFRMSQANTHVAVMETIHLNNKDRLLKVRVNNYAYLIFINASSSLLLNTEEINDSDNDAPVTTTPNFQALLSNLYSK